MICIPILSGDSFNCKEFGIAVWTAEEVGPLASMTTDKNLEKEAEQPGASLALLIPDGSTLHGAGPKWYTRFRGK